MIILYHYTARYNESIYTAKEYITNWTVRVPWRSLAVCTFFLLSGYISGIYRMGSALEYLRKRLIRIWLTFIKNLGLLYFEEGYGEVLGIVDEEIIKFQKR